MGTTLERPANIHTAKLAVMQEVGYCRKTRAAGLGYSFAGEAALIEALRPAMVDHGIVFGAVAYDIVGDTSYQTKAGASMRLVRVKGVFRFTHAPSGTHEDVVAFGEGADNGDKSLNKAMTGALKYALRQTFVIETGDDPDKYPSEPMAEPAREERPARVEEHRHVNGHSRPLSGNGSDAPAVRTPYERLLRPALHRAVKNHPDIWPDPRAVNDALLAEARPYGLGSLDSIKGCADEKLLAVLANVFDRESRPRGIEDAAPMTNNGAKPAEPTAVYREFAAGFAEAFGKPLSEGAEQWIVQRSVAKAYHIDTVEQLRQMASAEVAGKILADAVTAKSNRSSPATA